MSQIALDANLLQLLVVGLTSRDFIAKHKKLQRYGAAELDLLVDLIDGRTIVVTHKCVDRDLEHS